MITLLQGLNVALAVILVLVAVALGVLFVAPLQRIGEVVSRRVVPVGGQEDSYVAYRRVQIYKVALEGALRDGIVDTSERKALENLREELGLSMADQERLEQEIQGRLETPT